MGSRVGDDGLRTRLTRYLSPPLFPVRIRDLDARVVLHDAPEEPVSIGGFEVVAQHVIHPGPTVGYRISADGASVAYLPDHEPALGARRFPKSRAGRPASILPQASISSSTTGSTRMTSALCGSAGVTASVSEAVAFAELARVRRLILFHHDPSHSDAVLDELTEWRAHAGPRSRLSPVARALSTTGNRRPRLKANGHRVSIVAGLRLGGRAGFRDDVGPEIDRRLSYRRPIGRVSPRQCSTVRWPR